MGTDDPPMGWHTTFAVTTVLMSGDTSAGHNNGDETQDGVDGVVVAE